MKIEVNDTIQFTPYGRYRVKEVKTDGYHTVIVYVPYDRPFDQSTMVITKTGLSAEELKIKEE